MMQETIFIDSSTGERLFSLSFLYETKEGNKLNQKIINGSETFINTYEIVDIENDEIYFGAITRRIHIFKDPNSRS